MWYFQISWEMSKFSTGKSSTFNCNHVFQTSVILGNVQVLKSVMKSQVGNIYLDRFIKNEDTEIGIFIELRVAYQLSWQWQPRTATGHMLKFWISGSCILDFNAQIRKFTSK